MVDRVAHSLAAAEALIHERGVTLTPIRRRVLEMILEAKRPLGAYALLTNLRTKAGSAMPPTIYRALDFLIAQGFVHKIESNNTFVACNEVRRAHSSHFVMCRMCGRTEEFIDAPVAAKLRRRAATRGFKIERQVIELHGICADCRTTSLRKENSDPARRVPA